MTVKTLWTCPNFGKTVAGEEIFAGDPIVNRIAHGVLHEICLLGDLDIPDLDENDHA